MTTSAFAVPELASGLETWHSNRLASMVAACCRNTTMAGALVAVPISIANARRPIRLARYAASLSSSSNVAGQASLSACGGWPSIVAGNARSAWR